MDLSKKYWISIQDGLSRETLNILNEYLINLKLENKAEANNNYMATLCRAFLIP